MNKLTLLSINIGTPREVEIKGQKVTTAIQKNPVAGPIFISKKGPAGDKPAVHPDAVYAISSEHYDYWAKELNKDRNTMNPGLFGENFTLSGLEETEIRLGDILQIGDVTLQVVCSRIPCTKLSWALGQPDDFLRRFSLSGKTGFYLSVLQEGFVKTGDTITHKTQDPTAITVAELARFFVSIDEATEDQLYHILSHEHLGLTGREMINRRLATCKDLSLMKKGRWSGWRKFIVDEIINEAQEIKSFWLKPEDGNPIAGYRPGQFLTCNLTSGQEKKLIRTWTISDFDPEHNRYRISVKKIPGGEASIFLHEQVFLESIIDVKPPNGSFTLDRATNKPVVLICAGIGITPMISMLKAHLKRDLRPISQMYFVYATQNGNCDSFKEEIKTTLSGIDSIKTLKYYSRPNSKDKKGIDYDIQGRFNIEDLNSLMDGSQIFWGGRLHDWPKQEGLFYLCGPASFQESVKHALVSWGVKEAKIFSESFNPYSGTPTGVKAEHSTVTFSKSGITAAWSEKEDLTILELAEKFGINAPNACRMGVCETCEVALEKGCVFYEHGHLANRSNQTVLTCCSKPASEELILEL